MDDWLEALNFNKTPGASASSFSPQFTDWNKFTSAMQSPTSLGSVPLVNPTPATSDWLSRESIFGGNGSSGWAPTLLGFGQAALGFSNARAQNRLAKENFSRYKAESDLNIANQAKGINERLETRQARRTRERYGNLSEAEQAGKVAEYMAKWGVKDKIGG